MVSVQLLCVRWDSNSHGFLFTAKPYREVQEKVAKLLEGRFLVGHALHNDASALLLTHPRKKTRDTQLYAPFRSGGRNSRPALRKLVQKELGLTIQEGEHSSVRFTGFIGGSDT